MPRLEENEAAQVAEKRENMGNDKVRELQEALSQAAKATEARRFHSLYDKVKRPDMLAAAWTQVRANGGAAGIDGKTIEDIKQGGVSQFLEGIERELRERTYRPSPLRRVWVPKPNGKKRGLGIPTVRDRVVQTAVKLVLEPIFEADFEPNSFGFRPGRSAHDAVAEVVKYLNFGCEQVIDADISACFDRIPVGPLMKAVARRVVDGAMLKLIRMWLDCGILEGETLRHPERGTPQGSPLSPLLANVYLDRLDKYWKNSGLTSRNGADAHLVRYCDDFVILGTRDTDRAMRTLEAIMAELGLELSPEKTRVVGAEDGFVFLGFRFLRQDSLKRGKRETRWFPSPKSEQKIRDKVWALTRKDRLVKHTPKEAKTEVEAVLRGWGTYFRTSLCTTVFHDVWEYANTRLARMARRMHQGKRLGSWEDLKRKGLRLDKPPSPMYPTRARWRTYDAAG